MSLFTSSLIFLKSERDYSLRVATTISGNLLSIIKFWLILLQPFIIEETNYKIGSVISTILVLISIFYLLQLLLDFIFLRWNRKHYKPFKGNLSNAYRAETWEMKWKEYACIDSLKNTALIYLLKRFFLLHTRISRLKLC